MNYAANVTKSQVCAVSPPTFFTFSKINTKRKKVKSRNCSSVSEENDFKEKVSKKQRFSESFTQLELFSFSSIPSSEGSQGGRSGPKKKKKKQKKEKKQVNIDDLPLIRLIKEKENQNKKEEERNQETEKTKEVEEKKKRTEEEKIRLEEGLEEYKTEERKKKVIMHIMSKEKKVMKKYGEEVAMKATDYCLNMLKKAEKENRTFNISTKIYKNNVKAAKRLIMKVKKRNNINGHALEDNIDNYTLNHNFNGNGNRNGSNINMMVIEKLLDHPVFGDRIKKLMYGNGKQSTTTVSFMKKLQKIFTEKELEEIRDFCLDERTKLEATTETQIDIYDIYDESGRVREGWHVVSF